LTTVDTEIPPNRRAYAPVLLTTDLGTISLFFSVLKSRDQKIDFHAILFRRSAGSQRPWLRVPASGFIGKRLDKNAVNRLAPMASFRTNAWIVGANVDKCSQVVAEKFSSWDGFLFTKIAFANCAVQSFDRYHIEIVSAI
jgi:hypothetical protein